MTLACKHEGEVQRMFVDSSKLVIVQSYLNSCGT